MRVLQLLLPLTQDAWASAVSAASAASVASAAAAAFAPQGTAAVLVNAPPSTRGQRHGRRTGATAVARQRAARRVVLAGVAVANGREDPAGERGGLPVLAGGTAAAAGRAVACGRCRAHGAAVWDPLRPCRQCGVESSRQDRRRARASARRVRPGVASERVARGTGGLRRA